MTHHFEFAKMTKFKYNPYLKNAKLQIYPMEL